MKANLITAGILIFVVLLGYGTLFWPTPYAYEDMAIGNTSFPVRTNRLTGHKQYKLVTGEWKPLILHEEEKSDNSESKSVPSNSEWKVQVKELSIKNMLGIHTPNGTETGDQTDDPGFFTVQVGAFKDPEKAGQLNDELAYSGYQTKVEYPESEEGGEYRVLIGEFRRKEDAMSFAEELREDLADEMIHLLDGEE